MCISLLEGAETIGWKVIEDLKQEIKPYEKKKKRAIVRFIQINQVHLYIFNLVNL